MTVETAGGVPVRQETIDVAELRSPLLQAGPHEAGTRARPWRGAVAATRIDGLGFRARAHGRGKVLYTDSTELW